MDTTALAAPAVGQTAALTTSPDGNEPMVAAVLLLDPIAAPAESLAVLPASADVALYIAPADGLPTISGPPVFEVRAIAIGNAVFDLSDGYSLSIDELQSAIFVANALTGESILVWGTAQIALDGAEAARFWGTTTIELRNGTKITMETAADAAMADLFRLDKLTVTKDDRAMVITGIGESTLGDLAVVQSLGGEAIDDATRDGFAIVSDVTDSWSDEWGNAVDQALLDETAPGELYGPGSELLSLGEISKTIWKFVSHNQLDSLILTLNRGRDAAHERRSEATEVYRAMALYASAYDRPPGA